MTLAEPPLATSPQQLRAPPRLLALDVYRGLVILAMLIVNNIASPSAGYFWRHADWREGRFGESFVNWFEALRAGTAPARSAFTQFPLWRHCTLADFVMPMFMLIIGLSIPFSAASAKRRGDSRGAIVFRTLRRGGLLVLLGWILCYFRDQFPAQVHGDKPFTISLGMDVLQLLGVAYVVARLLYALPIGPRVGAIAALFLWHWAFLKFGAQGEIPRGTFELVRDPGTGKWVEHSAVKYAYDHWNIWGGRLTSWLSISFVGLLSVPPAAAMMLLGSIAGERLKKGTVPFSVPEKKGTVPIFVVGAVCVVVGVAWAFDLPMNKPRWTPCYLLHCAGVGFLLIALLQRLFRDFSPSPQWTLPLVALGTNAIAAYFLPILVKVLVFNVPRVSYDGKTVSLGEATVRSLQNVFGPAGGGWAFTVLFVAAWCAIFLLMHRRGWVIRV